MQLLDRDPLADRVGLIDVARAEHQRVHIPLITLRFGAVWHGDPPRRAGREAGCGVWGYAGFEWGWGGM